MGLPIIMTSRKNPPRVIKDKSKKEVVAISKLLKKELAASKLAIAKLNKKIKASDKVKTKTAKSRKKQLKFLIDSYIKLDELKAKQARLKSTSKKVLEYVTGKLSAKRVPRSKRVVTVDRVYKSAIQNRDLRESTNSFDVSIRFEDSEAREKLNAVLVEEFKKANRYNHDYRVIIGIQSEFFLDEKNKKGTAYISSAFMSSKQGSIEQALKEFDNIKKNYTIRSSSIELEIVSISIVEREPVIRK